MEADYFAILWWFLPYIHMSQPWVYMGSPSWPSLPIPSLGVIPVHQPWAPCLILSQLFHSPFSLSSRGSLVPPCFLSLVWCHLPIWSYFSQQTWFQLVFYPATHFAWCTQSSEWVPCCSVKWIIWTHWQKMKISWWFYMIYLFWPRWYCLICNSNKNIK